MHRVSGLCLSEPSGTFGLLSRRRLQLTAAAEKRKAGASEMKLLPELIPCKKWDYYTQVSLTSDCNDALDFHENTFKNLC